MCVYSTYVMCMYISSECRDLTKFHDNRDFVLSSSVLLGFDCMCLLLVRWICPLAFTYYRTYFSSLTLHASDIGCDGVAHQSFPDVYT